MIKFAIPGTLPGWNQANKGHWAKRAKLKREIEEYIGWIIKPVRYQPLQCPIRIDIKFYEPNRKRDIDNVKAGTKFILDALVKMRVIPDDGQKYVSDVTSDVLVDREKPRVEVEIKEAD